MNNLEKLYSLNIQDITSITIRTVGLLDTFGKMLLDIILQSKDNKSTELITIEFISPVPVDAITKWLTTNNLLDITTLYKF